MASVAVEQRPVEQDQAPAVAPPDLSLTLEVPEQNGLSPGAVTPDADSGVVLKSEEASPTEDNPLSESAAQQSTEEKPQDKQSTAPAQIHISTSATAEPSAKFTVSTPTKTMSGPDTVLETETVKTWTRDDCVKLRMGKSGALAEVPISVPTVFANTVKRNSAGIALAVKRGGGDWKKWTYLDYQRDVTKAARAMIKLGLEAYHGVGIIGFNSPEWFIADLAAIHAGGFAVGIYTTNSPEACHYVAENCEANIIIVENDQQLQKILKVRDRLPHLKTIVQYTGTLKERYPDTYTWSEFLEKGADVPESALKERLQQQAPNKCCTLIYTSGTTGNPKGVMLSHDNLTWTAKVAGNAAKVVFAQEVVISYLPLSHIAAQLLDIYIPMFFGGAVYFAQPDALKGSLAVTLREVRPTTFLGVPRVWEKMHEKLLAMGKGMSGMKRKLGAWAKGVGLKGNMALMNGGSTPMGWSIANAIAFKKVRQGLGLDRCRFCLTGAAPIMRETLDYFMSVNVPLMELYGMSESTGPHTVSFPWRHRITSVGLEFPGASTKLDSPDADGNGEICMGGRHVFMGYLNMEEKTKEAIDEEGWLRTGDVGRKDQDGFLFITGRIKELLITAGGENVPPVPIEDIVKEELPCIGNCMLIGDKKKFLSILLTFKVEVDGETNEPLDKLSDPALDWCKGLGSACTDVSQILDSKDEKVLRGIQDGIDRANKRATSRAQVVQKWSILPRDFSIPGGELGPTLKLKRPVVSKMYKNTIDAFYAD